MVPLFSSLIVALSIAYFFYGQYIPHPLFAHSGYDPAFVMNYVGLGVTQGFFLYAQTAAGFAPTAATVSPPWRTPPATPTIGPTA